MAKRAAQGAGTIRKKVVTRNGKQYTYWEARITTGHDPGTGKQIQQSFSGKTQKEVREKMQAAAVTVNTGTYIAPLRITVGQWLDIWLTEYMNHAKPSTLKVYRLNIKNHIKPFLGAVKLCDLQAHTVQAHLNSMKGMATSSIRLTYIVLHSALQKAVALDYIPKNPADRCTIPKVTQAEIKPLSDQDIVSLLEASKGSRIEHLVTVALFTGMRESELLGLTWDSVDFNNQTVSINKQLTKPEYKDTSFFTTPKSGKPRMIHPAEIVFDALEQQRISQIRAQIKIGALWCNEHNLVFTTAAGKPIYQFKVERDFKQVLSSAGLSGIRFHDLRHTYAVNFIRAGDDIKTIQGNLGHSSAAFTLDKYGHFTDQMKQESASRMNRFMKDVLNL